MKNLFFALITAISLFSSLTLKAADGDKKVTMILTHEVKDYAKWREAFDAGAPMRDKAGIVIINVFTSVDNANLVTVVSEAPSAEVAKGFGEKIKASLEKAGVTSKPELKILSKM